MTVNVLGTKYSIHYKSPSEDKFLRECDGYCDKSSKKIVVTTENIELENFVEYQKKCLRHFERRWGQSGNKWQIKCVKCASGRIVKDTDKEVQRVRNTEHKDR